MLKREIPAWSTGDRTRDVIRILLIVLWLAPLAFAPWRQYAMEHDSVNHALAASEFSIAKHQPHPAGFPYWILMLKGATRLGIDPIRGQTLLAFLFTLAAAAIWWKIDPEPGFGSGLLMLLSPAAWYYAAAPTTYAVDLAFSCALLYFARPAWNGDARSALGAAVTAGIWSGFRSAPAVFVLPLVAVCAWRARSLWRPAAAFIALWSLWYVPVVVMTGGYGMFTRYSSEMALPAFAQTSAVYGASLRTHLNAMLGTSIFLALMLAPPAFAFLLSRRRAPAVPFVEDREWLFAMLATGPALLFTTQIHGPKPGYVLMLLPPVMALLAGRMQLTGRALAAAAVLSASLSFMPYERVLRQETSFQFTRATLRSLFLIEEAHRRIASEPQDCGGTVRTNRAEAPNRRTLAYHFPETGWTGRAGGCVAVTSPWQEVAGAERIDGNAIYSLWRTKDRAAK